MEDYIDYHDIRYILHITTSYIIILYHSLILSMYHVAFSANDAFSQYEFKYSASIQARALLYAL